MFHQSSSTDRHVSPAQVWVHLATDCRTRAIRLMAQLAFKLVAEQSTSEEAEHALASRHAENPA